MAEIVPCLAEELSVQAMKLEANAAACEYDDEVFHDLAIAAFGNSHSNRDLSLLELGDFMGPEAGCFGSCDYTTLDSQQTPWDNCSGPSSAASCDLSTELMEVPSHDIGMSSKKRSSASSAKLNKEDMDEAGADPAAGEAVDCHHPRTFRLAGNKRMGMESQHGHLAHAANMPLGSLDAACYKKGGNQIKSSQQGWKMMQGRQDGGPWHCGTDGLHLRAQIPSEICVLNQQLCLSPLSGVSTDLSLELQTSVDADLGQDDVAGPTLGNYRSWQPGPERLKKGSNRDASSPHANGPRRPAGPTSTARKLMVHPEGHACMQCGARSTPVWRAGPNGPKTLCNACGVRYSKIARKK